MNHGRAFGESIEPLRPAGVGSRPHRVVTLAYLSDALPNTLISQQLARSLCAETNAPVILVRFEAEKEKNDANGGGIPELYLNGEFHLPAQLAKTEAGFCLLSLAVRTEPPSAAGLDSMISQLSRLFRYVVIEVAINRPPAPWIFELLQRSSLAYLFLRGTTEDVYLLDVITRTARLPLSAEALRRSSPACQLKPVGCLAEGERIDGFDFLAQVVGSPLHMYVHDCPRSGQSEIPDGAEPQNGKLFVADVRRLAREIGGRLTGLALSSGAAKGFAHVGVIQVLEENGIEIDVVAGASMGAYVGA